MPVTPKLKIDEKDLPSQVMDLQAAAESTVSIALAAGAANVCTITVQTTDGLGANRSGVHALDLYFSTSATGANVTATTYSGSLVAVTGALLETITAAKIFRVLTDATGRFVGSLTATGKPVGEYVVVVKPRGAVVLSIPTTAALFG